MEKDGLIYNPPAWRVCEQCEGSGHPYDGAYIYENDDCIYCNGTGRIPICYTPDEWTEAGGVLSDDTPCWNRDLDGRWLISTYRCVKKSSPIIIIPGHTRPPKGWIPKEEPHERD